MCILNRMFGRFQELFPCKSLSQHREPQSLMARFIIFPCTWPCFEGFVATIHCFQSCHPALRRFLCTSVLSSWHPRCRKVPAELWRINSQFGMFPFGSTFMWMNSWCSFSTVWESGLEVKIDRWSNAHFPRENHLKVAEDLRNLFPKGGSWSELQMSKENGRNGPILVSKLATWHLGKGPKQLPSSIHVQKRFIGPLP